MEDIRLPSNGKLNAMSIMYSLDPSMRHAELKDVYGSLVFPDIAPKTAEDRDSHNLSHESTELPRTATENTHINAHTNVHTNGTTSQLDMN